MSKDRRLDLIVECLQEAFNGKLGKNVGRNGTMKYITEIYPYKNGMFLLHTIHDDRALIFEDRKLLVFVKETGEIEILGECDIRNSQSIDTCVTEEFLDARYTYDVMLSNTKSILFRKKHQQVMDEKINYCKDLSRKAIHIIKIRGQNEE